MSFHDSGEGKRETLSVISLSNIKQILFHDLEKEHLKYHVFFLKNKKWMEIRRILKITKQKKN